MSSLEAIAADLAHAQHAGQTRRHGAPYVTHPRAVAELVGDLCYALEVPGGDALRAAAWLHDVIEDGDIDECALAQQVGEGVAARVARLTRTPRAPDESKSAHADRTFTSLRAVADDGDRLVKVADRVHNLSELHLGTSPAAARALLEETHRHLRPLAADAADPRLGRALVACLDDALCLAARLQGEANPRQPPLARPGLYAIIDVTPRSDLARAAALLRATLEGGALLVQVRVKNLDDRAWLEVLDALRPLAREVGVPFIVNDRADLAMLVEAEGVHVGQRDLAPARLRRGLGPSLLIGRSHHSVADIARTREEGGADYLAFGPVFASRTKQGHAELTGLGALERLCRDEPLPVCAIGGLQEPARMADVGRAGAFFGAAISAIAEAEAPRWLSRRLSLSLIAARAAWHALADASTSPPREAS